MRPITITIGVVLLAGALILNINAVSIMNRPVRWKTHAQYAPLFLAESLSVEPNRIQALISYALVSDKPYGWAVIDGLKPLEVGYGPHMDPLRLNYDLSLAKAQDDEEFDGISRRVLVNHPRQVELNPGRAYEEPFRIVIAPVPSHLMDDLVEGNASLFVYAVTEEGLTAGVALDCRSSWNSKAEQKAPADGLDPNPAT
jgi:hypothetical protein